MHFFHQKSHTSSNSFGQSSWFLFTQTYLKALCIYISLSIIKGNSYYVLLGLHQSTINISNPNHNHVFKLFLLFRSQNITSIKTGLSEYFRVRRHRKYTISIQMTVTSWSLELTTGLISLINIFFFTHDASLEITTQVLIAVHIFLYFVVIPGSYLLSTEVYRNLIFDKGWHTVLPFRKNKRQVAPEPIEKSPPNSSVNPSSGTQQKSESSENSDMRRNEEVFPIPTISGNVNLETSYKVY